MTRVSDIFAVRNSKCDVTLTVVDNSTDMPMDLSSNNVSVELRVKIVGGAGAPTVVPCAKLIGLQSGNVLITTSPYDVPGRGGRVQAEIPAAAFPTPGDYLAEVRLVYLADDPAVPAQLITIDVRSEL